MAVKKFVLVIAKFEENGKITPLKILWEDGRAFDVDFIFDIRPRSSLKVGVKVSGISVELRIKMFMSIMRNRDGLLRAKSISFMIKFIS